MQAPRQTLGVLESCKELKIHVLGVLEQLCLGDSFLRLSSILTIGLPDFSCTGQVLNGPIGIPRRGQIRGRVFGSREK